jgi:hypothetical protein
MKRGFVIDSLPRTGSTTLSQLLSCHPEVTCLDEPFHPRRYGGQYHRMSETTGSVGPALNLIWHRWTGIKHVWESPTMWPFIARPELNEQVLSEASRVLLLSRRNLLRRYVSHAICRQIRFWIGTRTEFLSRLDNVQLQELDCNLILHDIERSKEAIARRILFCKTKGVPYLHLEYEQLFAGKTEERNWITAFNVIFEFLGVRQVSLNDLGHRWRDYLNPDIYQWATEDVYRAIPNIDEVEGRLGSDDNGYLFR